MTQRGDPRHPARPPERGSRYLVSLALTVVALAATTTLDASGVETFAPIVGAVAVSYWYGGFGPGLVSLGLGWTTAWFELFHPRGSLGMPTPSEFARWLTPAVVSVIVLWVSWALRRAETRAEVKAHTAELKRSTTEALQRLASELSSAVTPSDVAHTLVERIPAMLGSTGAALGLVDGDHLQIVDPEGAPQQTLTPGMRLALDTRAPITTAARTGELTFVRTREAFVRDYPGGATLAPYASGALAVPLRASGNVVGAMGFPFGEPETIDDEVIAIARLAADLGGQALERAGLYEQERQSREALDRILRLAPLFDSESPEALVEAICKEAITTFGADAAQVWATAGDGFEVVWREPQSEALLPGTRVLASDFPGLTQAMEQLETLFVADAQASFRGSALKRARHFGIRSTLGIPIVLRGRTERVLTLQWTRVLPEPLPSTIALARRLADQAGLALEHAERRVAQAAASRNADETRRLLDVTASLAAALEPAGVASAILREAFRGLDAQAGSVVRLNGERELELVSAVGYPDGVLEGWQTFALDADLPLADAVRRNEIVALESPAERARRYPGLPRTDMGHEAWLSLPLVAGGRVLGGLGLSFTSSRPFSDSDREFGLALSRQAGQALERSTLLETEHAARIRAERMAGDLAQLHALSTSLGRAGNTTDVTRIVAEQMIHGVGAGTAGVYTLGTDSNELVLFDVSGQLKRSDLVELERIPGDDPGPIASAVRLGRPVWLVEDADWEAFPSAAPWRHVGARALGVFPLVVEQKVIGALFATFDEEMDPAGEDRRFVETVARQAGQPLERSRLFDEERVMRRRADRLQGLTTALSGALTPNEVIDVFLREASAAVEASGVAMGVLDQGSQAPKALDWRDDGVHLPASWLDSTLGRRTPLSDAIQGGQALYFDDANALLATYPDAMDLVDTDGRRAFAFVPVAVGRKPFAVTVITWDRPASPIGTERSFIETIASQCGQALDRAQRYEAERTIAETLQRSVLPETLPSMEGATVAARYLPGTTAVDVGGDWFDTILLADGRLGFVVGDVVGKGVQAASTMAQLRNGMRALTLDSSDPAAIVTKLNRLLDGYTEAPFATLIFVTIDPTTHETSVISAGHLPPLVLAAGDEPRFLEGGRGLPLGVDPDTVYTPWSTTLEPGSMIVLYTDGLIERRDRSLDEGLRLLIEATAEAPTDPDDVVDRVIERLLGNEPRGDDVAVLAVALDRAPLGTFAVHLPADRGSLVDIRQSFGRWLDRGGIPEADQRDLMLATWEASANAVEHARDPREPTIAITASLVGDKVRVEVSDSGSWEEPRERPERGLGLRLIEALMTSLTVERGEQGTRVIMERSLSRERAGKGGTNAPTDYRSA